MRARALILVASLASMAWSLGLACTSSDGGGGAASCPNDLPADCPTTPPSFQADVEPIFASKCWGCHADGGVAVNIRDLSSYDKIAAQRSLVLTQFYSCKMPPSDAGQPSADERAKMLAWLVCKAPNN
jgi:hypothetical protein